MLRPSFLLLTCAGFAMLCPLHVAGDEFPIRFDDVTAKAGLRKPLAGLMGHGGAIGDVDGDGDLDLFIGGFADRPDEKYAPAKGPVPNHLFLNQGNARFVEAKNQHVRIFARTSGAVFADLDNDGLLELYVANNARDRAKTEGEPQRSAKLQPSQLFDNRDGKLVEVTKPSGAVPAALLSARNVGVLDYDLDGRLDLLIVEDRFRRGTSRSALLRNEGGLRFRDVTADVGLPEDVFGLGLAVADVNGDRRPDFFVPHSNRFFLSRGEKYIEPPQLKKTFAWQPLHNEDWPCGAAFGDLNGDGRLDLVLSIHCTTARNRVYLNRGLKGGVPQFEDVTQECGLGDVVPTRCPHVEIQDFDNDGRPDIYLSAAWLDEDGSVTPLIYRNTGAKKTGIPQFAPPRPIGEPMVYFPAGPSGDVDGDGRLDLLLINWFAGNHTRLLLGASGEKAHWLRVRAQGAANTEKGSNRIGIGSEVRLYKPGTRELLGLQQIQTGYGYASGQPAAAHFGLGKTEQVDIEVTFPSGKKVTQRGVAADRKLTIKEPQ